MYRIIAKDNSNKMRSVCMGENVNEIYKVYDLLKNSKYNTWMAITKTENNVTTTLAVYEY